MPLAQLPTRHKDVLQDIKALPPIECGEEARQYFSFAPGYRNLNHGSFGTYPTIIRSVVHHYQNAAEARPDDFIRYEYPALLDVSREHLAKLLKVNIEELVLLSNATLGINTVLRALQYEQGDVIIYFSSIYGACEKTVEYLTETTPVRSKRITHTYPISDDGLCNAFTEAIKEVQASGGKAKLAIFDTVVSMPGVRVPFERLTELCRQHGVLSCIDGAHSVGQLDINLGELKPDFYVSNCHKWLHVPRGCAVFHVPVRNQHLIRSTLPTSHGFIPLPKDDGAIINNPLPPTTKSHFVNSFEFVGTLDNSPYLCIPASIEWRSKLTWQGQAGEPAILSYIQQLAVDAAELTAAALGTEVLENEAKTLTKCGMSNVRLPLSYKNLADGDFATAVKLAQWMSKILVQEYDTFIAILIHNESWWVRLSAQVYLTKDDFVYGAKSLKALCERVEKGEWRQ